MSLDPYTLQTLIVVTSLTMVLALALVATGHRVPGLWSLAGAVLCIALTFLAYEFHAALAGGMAAVLANITTSVALSLLAAAILQLRGSRLHMLWLLAPPIAATVLSVLGHGHAFQIMASDGMSALQGALALWLLLRGGGIAVGQGRHILVGSVLVLTLLFLGRFLTMATGLVPAPPPLLTDDPIDTATYLLLHLIMVFATLGFVLAAAELTADRHHQLAMQDPLTDLPNRRAVLDALERHWSAAVRTQRPLTVLMIDIDHFKQINDQHGHPAGDAVLRRLARLLRARVRSQDIVGRFGGEEFLVVLPDTAPDTAATLAEALRGRIESVPVRARGRMLPLTASMGLHGLWPGAGDTVDDAIQKADEALYRAKSAGRNRVVAA